VVAQAYKVEVEVLGASRGCTAVLRCVVPSFVKDLIRVVSWVQEPSFFIYPSLLGGKFGCAVKLTTFGGGDLSGPHNTEGAGLYVVGVSNQMTTIQGRHPSETRDAWFLLRRAMTQRVFDAWGQ